MIHLIYGFIIGAELDYELIQKESSELWFHCWVSIDMVVPNCVCCCQKTINKIFDLNISEYGFPVADGNNGNCICPHPPPPPPTRLLSMTNPDLLILSRYGKWARES